MALLKTFRTDFGDIRILRSARDGSISYFQNGCFHSQSTKKGISLCAYVHVIHEIIRQSHERNILIIGCAGGTLATMLRRLHCKVTVVDINFLAFRIARDYFQMPKDVRCIRRDGIAYLRTTRKKYDAIIIDVFGNHNQVPNAFTDARFFKKVGNALSPSGRMIMNVITKDDGDQHADNIARHAESTGMKVTMFDWKGENDRNTLIVSGKLQNVHIPSGKEPAWMKPDLLGISRHKPKKHQF